MRPFLRATSNSSRINRAFSSFVMENFLSNRPQNRKLFPKESSCKPDSTRRQSCVLHSATSAYISGSAYKVMCLLGNG